MIYPYMVKHNDRWYAAGEDVPVDAPVAVVDETPVDEEPVAGEADKPKKATRTRKAKK
ncbi:MAG: hypothetical protein IJ680_05815 [Paludibacteraceae bacterium]|nr:hypothetical protein [Paludibacteraceae bacterium]